MIEARAVERIARVRRTDEGTLVADWVVDSAERCSTCDGTCGAAMIRVPILLPPGSDLPPGALISIAAPQHAVRRALLTVFGIPLLAVCSTTVLAAWLRVDDVIAAGMAFMGFAMAILGLATTMGKPWLSGARIRSTHITGAGALDSDDALVNNGARCTVGSADSQ